MVTFMKIAFYTLGCKTNQFETQALETMFSERGHEIVPFTQVADAYIINTCTVTAMGDKKSRNAAHRAKTLNPAGLLIVCGCYAQVKPEEVREMCGADIVCGNGDKSRIVELTEQAYEDRKYVCTVRPGFDHGPFDFMPAGSLKGRTRALLKVQDGCQNFCSYCLIPYARGLSRSMPLDQVRSEAARLGQAGYKEIVVTGIEISSYGFDLPGKPSPTEMIAAICEAAPEARIRLGSLEPRTVTEDFCTTLAPYKNLCPHFHLSLQSGCDKTLKDMNRKYDTARYFLSCQLLRQYFPGCAITTDLIVGFPGETEEDFALTVDFAKQARFLMIHVFPYSERRGTVAATLSGRVPEEIRHQRVHELSAVQAEIQKQILDTYTNTSVDVLFETYSNGTLTGHTDTFVEVACEAPRSLQSQVRRVFITANDGKKCIGTLCPHSDKKGEN